MTLTLAVVALVPLVVAFLVASFRDPVGITLPAYALVLPFGQALPTGLGGGAFGSLSSLLGLVLGAALLIQLATTRRSVLRPPVSAVVWLAYLALAGASVTWSIAPQRTAFDVTALGSLVLLFVLLAIIRVERRELVRVEDAVLLGGVASAGYGILQLLVLGGVPTGEFGDRARFGDDLLGPNNQAASLLLPLAIVLVRIALRSRGGLPLNASMAALILISILMTGSRGGLVAVAVTLVVLAMATPLRHRKTMIGIGAASLTLITLALAVNPAEIGERQVTAGGASSGREEVWAVGLHACRTYCLTGSGWGTFGQVYALERAEVPEARVLGTGTAKEPHNVAMLVGIETGLLGLILVVVAFALTARSALRLPAGLRGPPLAALAGVGCAGFFLSFLGYKFVWMALMYVVLCRNASGDDTEERVAETPSLARR